MSLSLIVIAIIIILFNLVVTYGQSIKHVKFELFMFSNHPLHCLDSSHFNWLLGYVSCADCDQVKSEKVNCSRNSTQPGKMTGETMQIERQGSPLKHIPNKDVLWQKSKFCEFNFTLPQPLSQMQTTDAEVHRRQWEVVQITYTNCPSYILVNHQAHLKYTKWFGKKVFEYVKVHKVAHMLL